MSNGMRARHGSRAFAQKSHTLAELAKAAGPGGNRPEGMEPGLEARYYYETMDAPFAFGVHLAEVEVEPETGHVEITRYVVVNDCGRLINPMIVDGQIVGGIAQGVGGALLEELVYDEDGQMLSANLMDYQLPTSLDLPDVEISHYESPSPLNPLGVKGIGEGGAIAGHAVVANAVEDALAHTGARVLETPLRPAVIWRLLQEGGSASPVVLVPSLTSILIAFIIRRRGRPLGFDAADRRNVRRAWPEPRRRRPR